MANHSITGSGDGTRPTTSGGVDNIGGGERFTDQRNAAGEEITAPAPRERMQDKRKDVEATKHDDSDAFGLHEDLTPDSNQDPAQPQAPSQTPAQKAMKQFSKTPAERGEPAPAPGAAHAATSRPPPTAGDAPVGESDNQGSSPYGDRSRKEAPQRER